MTITSYTWRFGFRVWPLQGSTKNNYGKGPMQVFHAKMPISTVFPVRFFTSIKNRKHYSILQFLDEGISILHMSKRQNNFLKVSESSTLDLRIALKIGICANCRVCTGIDPVHGGRGLKENVLPLEIFRRGVKPLTAGNINKNVKSVSASLRLRSKSFMIDCPPPLPRSNLIYIWSGASFPIFLWEGGEFCRWTQYIQDFHPF